MEKGVDGMDNGYVTQKAREFIKQYEINWLPVDPFELMDKLNIQYKSIGDLVLKTGLDRKWLIDEVIFGEDGLIFYEPDTDSDKIILNEKIEPFERIRWTIMHEIGHAYLGHLNSKKTSILKWKLSKEEYNKYEQEAQIFAEEVLAPKFILYLICAHSISEIMEICGIPKPAAESRANAIIELINNKKNT
jgi:Zn-dependent peptidase ImmA (M78 family)